MKIAFHDYYKEKYGKDSKFLAYGADIHDDYNVEHLKEYGLKPEEYYILVARLEPENNIVMVKECLQYIGIIVIAMLSGLFLVIKMAVTEAKEETRDIERASKM